MTYAHAERNLAATRLVVADTMRLLVGRDDIPTPGTTPTEQQHVHPGGPGWSTYNLPVFGGEVTGREIMSSSHKSAG
jgi:hypothetical protein